MKFSQEELIVLKTFVALCSEKKVSNDILKLMRQITESSKNKEEHLRKIDMLYKIVQRSKDEAEMQRHLEEYKRDLGIE